MFAAHSRAGQVARRVQEQLKEKANANVCFTNLVPTGLPLIEGDPHRLQQVSIPRSNRSPISQGKAGRVGTHVAWLPTALSRNEVWGVTLRVGRRGAG